MTRVNSFLLTFICPVFKLYFLKHLAVIVNITFNLYMHYSIIQKHKVQES